MLPFKSCCLCCKLETGAYVIGGIGFAACFLNILMSSLILDGQIEDPLPGIEGHPVFQLVWSIVAFFMYILLIIGTKKRNSRLILPFLIIDFIGLILILIAFIAFVRKVPIEGDALPFVIGYPLGLVLGVYLWLCMYSLYSIIKNERYYNKNEYV